VTDRNRQAKSAMIESGKQLRAEDFGLLPIKDGYS
jgi:hypothetical protein